jgi:hypothetical protein
MFILPFIHHIRTVNHMQVSIFRFLVLGGNALWKEDDSHDLEADVLHPNDIFLSGVPIKMGTTYLCPVDTLKTNLSDFYQWTEIQQGAPVFCWRTFYVVGDSFPDESLGHHRYQELFHCIGHLNAPRIY